MGSASSSPSSPCASNATDSAGAAGSNGIAPSPDLAASFHLVPSKAEIRKEVRKKRSRPVADDWVYIGAGAYS